MFLQNRKSGKKNPLEFQHFCFSGINKVGPYSASDSSKQISSEKSKPE